MLIMRPAQRSTSQRGGDLVTRAGGETIRLDGAIRIVRRLEHDRGAAMLERLHGEAELLGDVEEHEHLVGAIRVRVDQPLALEDFHERLELQVATRRHHLRVRPDLSIDLDALQPAI